MVPRRATHACSPKPDPAQAAVAQFYRAGLIDALRKAGVKFTLDGD